jgi:hypothetical protein
MAKFSPILSKSKNNDAKPKNPKFKMVAEFNLCFMEKKYFLKNQNAEKIKLVDIL